MSSTPAALPARNVLIVSDNAVFLRLAADLVQRGAFGEAEVTLTCSPRHELPATLLDELRITPVDLKTAAERLVAQFDLVFSLHCKQLFPPALVRGVRCLNLHPGYNPYNRGWYPQVFSIINKRPFGATLHEIDEELDHGPIIDQVPVPLHAWDTSETAYARVVAAETALFERALPRALSGDYRAQPPAEEGNVNLKRDFAALCALDLSERLTMQQCIDRLRALTHGAHRNAYFTDPETGRRVYVRIALEPEPAPGAR